MRFFPRQLLLSGRFQRLGELAIAANDGLGLVCRVNHLAKIARPRLRERLRAETGRFYTNPRNSIGLTKIAYFLGNFSYPFPK